MSRTAREYVVLGGAALVLLVAANPTPAQTSVVPHQPVVGAKDMYVYLADFADAQVPCSLDEVENAANQVASFYTTYSFGQLTMTARLLTNPESPDGHFHVDHPCSDLLTDTERYDVELWDAIKAATGVDIPGLASSGAKIVKEHACFRGGSAGLGSPYAQVGRCWDAALLAHEVGHTLGVAHASKNRPPGSTRGEYGDREVMGHGGLVTELNAPHRMQLGWIPEGCIQTATSSTELVLGALDATPVDGGGCSAPTVVRIPKSADLVDSLMFKDFFYLSLIGGRVNVHGVELSPYDVNADQLLFGNTLYMGRKPATSGQYRDKTGRFSFVSASTTPDQAHLTIDICSILLDSL